jgi:filamentous hemagglutinin
MAALTKDMVWLVAQEVTLAGGSVQKVLAPQVYLASEGAGPAGPALVSGRDVVVASSGNLDNTGTIVARDTMQLAGDSLNNLGGRIQGNSVRINAQTDINVIGGAIAAGAELIAAAGRDIKIETTTRSATPTAGANQFGRTTIDRIGGLQVTGEGGSLVAVAGRPEYYGRSNRQQRRAGQHATRGDARHQSGHCHHRTQRVADMERQ